MSYKPEYRKGDKVTILPYGYLAENNRNVIGNDFFKEWQGAVCTVVSVGDCIDAELPNGLCAAFDYTEIRHHFEYGELIEVNDRMGRWYTWMYRGYLPGDIFPWVTSNGAVKESYKYEYARPIRKPEISEDDINAAIDTLEKAGRLKDGKVVV